MSEHERLRALASARIAWPAGEGIETTGDPARGWPGPRIAGTGLCVGDAGRNLARDFEACRDWYPELSDDQCRAAADYFRAHVDLFQAHWWRTMPCDGIAYGPNGNRERLQADVRALLAERDALAGDTLLLETRQRLYAAEDEIARLRAERDVLRGALVTETRASFLAMRSTVWADEGVARYLSARYGLALTAEEIARTWAATAAEDGPGARCGGPGATGGA